MNKTLVTIFTVIVLGLSLTSLAQSFTVTSPSTDPYQQLCKPIKAGGSFPLQIKVKSNTKDTLTISIDKFFSFGTWADWFTIDVNSYTIVKDQTVVFLLTVNIPANTSENKYYFIPYFNARKGTSNSPFQGGEFNIIVDNTPPSTPNVNITDKTSSSITITYGSYDARSNEYTNANGGSGIGGIKSYTLELKKPNGDIQETKSANATDISSSFTFSNLAGYTVYTAIVTATDLATNSKTSPGLASRTKVAAPSCLPAANIGFCNATLAWAATPGATRYQIYTSAEGSNASITSSTSFPVEGLAANTRYTYYISAAGAEGESPRSALTFSTLAVPAPIVDGASLICSSGTSFSVSNLPSGCSVLWNKSANVNLSSSQGGSATFIPSGDGEGFVNAAIMTCGGNSTAVSIPVWAGTPRVDYISGPQHASNTYWEETYNALPFNLQACASYHWEVIPSYSTLWTGTYEARIRFPYEADYQVIVTADNLCGTSAQTVLYVAVGSYEPFVISPNPVSECMEVEMNREQTNTITMDMAKSTHAKMNRSVQSSSTKYTIRITDAYGATMLVKKAVGDSFSIPVNSLKNGVYIINIDNGQSSYSQRFVVKH